MTTVLNTLFFSPKTILLVNLHHLHFIFNLNKLPVYSSKSATKCAFVFFLVNTNKKHNVSICYQEQSSEVWGRRKQRTTKNNRTLELEHSVTLDQSVGQPPFSTVRLINDKISTPLWVCVDVCSDLISAAASLYSSLSKQTNHFFSLLVDTQ